MKGKYLFRHIEKTPTCWLWTGCLNENGYGICKFGESSRLAHRAMYIVQNGSIPDGLYVLHKCDNPRCVNPDHLFVGTHLDNMKDMTIKGRQVCGERHAEIMRRVAARGERHMSKTRPDTVRKGEKASGARLTESQVLDIRARYTAGGITQRKLAEDFNINQSQISDVVARVTWKHI